MTYHRDIKAANIMLTRQGQAKLADFGVSTTLASTMSKRNTMIGTPFWMAPEVIKESNYDGKADVWSLGITAIEMADFNPPLSDQHPMRAIFKIPVNPPPTLKDPSRWSDDFNGFIAFVLKKDPTERPSAADALKHPFLSGAAARLRESGGGAASESLRQLVEECMPSIEAAREATAAAARRRASMTGGGGGGGDDDVEMDGYGTSVFHGGDDDGGDGYGTVAFHGDAGGVGAGGGDDDAMETGGTMRDTAKGASKGMRTMVREHIRAQQEGKAAVDAKEADEGQDDDDEFSMATVVIGGDSGVGGTTAAAAAAAGAANLAAAASSMEGMTKEQKYMELGKRLKTVQNQIKAVKEQEQRLREQEERLKKDIKDLLHARG